MLIAIVGTDGAGKSTLVRRLAHWLEREGERVIVSDKWDVLRPSEFPECRFLSVSQYELGRHISAMPGASRAMFIFWSIVITARRHVAAHPDAVILMDGYWAKHLAAESRYGAGRAWLEQTIGQLPSAELTVCLDVLPETALRRKAELLPYECGLDETLDPNSFIEHQRVLREGLLALAKTHGWQQLSAEGPLDETFHSLQELVRLALDRRPGARSRAVVASPELVE